MANMNLEEYRRHPREKERIESLFNLISSGDPALDIGTRDGYLARKLAEKFDAVTALDLIKPEVVHPKIRVVTGDLRCLEFADNAFHTVLCAEVLEHIPTENLAAACAELARVVKTNLIIGVPYKQDLRLGRTKCYTCEKSNPPWGHVNDFDEKKLNGLFPQLRAEKIEFVGRHKEMTNSLSAILLAYAGNPYGTYDQEESCIHCGAKLISPPRRSVAQKISTKLALMLNAAQRLFARPRPIWIHVSFRKS
jgi:hypothetical protein